MRRVLSILMMVVTMLFGSGVRAENPTVELKWISHKLISKGFSADDDYAIAVRSGSGYGGKAYISNTHNIMTYDGTTVTTLYTYSDNKLNKGFAIDDAGNIAIARKYPTGNISWCQYLLIKADGSSATELTLTIPTSSTWKGKEADLVGRAVGDFFSERGGVFYLTANEMTAPIPVWIANGEVKQLEKSTSVEFDAASIFATANPSLPMDEITEDNVADAFYYKSDNATAIKYVSDGTAATVSWPFTTSYGQPGFDVFELGGVTYAVHSSISTDWDSDITIWNIETGEVIYTSSYESEYKGTTSGCGSSLVARKVSDTKVELYQAYLCGYDSSSSTHTVSDEAANSFNAYYEITISDDTSGIQNSIDAHTAPEYYNLQGLRVENPKGGIFICRQGPKVCKVVK